MFCHGDLGRNEVIEDFPVGRRLAFDGDRGRLWVICRKCERWNLTPLEERWEAIEACERFFRDTRTRVSTEQIGLARLSEGLVLIRIGAPQRPEFAAWRYGDQFGRRRKKAILVGGAAVGVLGVATVAGVVTGAISGIMAAQSGNFYNAWAHHRVVAKFRMSDGRVLKIKAIQLERAQIFRPDEGEPGWKLGIEHKGGRDLFSGDEAFLLTSRMMARVNRAGGRKGAVQEAVAQIEAARHPEAFLAGLVEEHAVTPAPPRYPLIGLTGKPLSPEKQTLSGGKGSVGLLDKPTRLALEMALHEEQERRALEGELSMLEEAWRQAEEVAAISDDLLLPEGTDEFIERHRPAG